jgi:hypothetical protein
MNRFPTDRGMLIAALLLGALACLFGLAVAFYGDVLFPAAAPRISLLANYFVVILRSSA